MLRRLMRQSVCLLAVLSWASLVNAQTLESVSEKDFLSEMPMVLSVSRLPQRLDETPGAVTLIDREMIRRSGARDVVDLLRLVPGFQTSTSFETGAPLASYHGGFDGYSARIQVLVDGRSVYSPYFFGGTGLGLQTVALQDIERIEVLRGSNSAAYGARAMLGVINIVTRHPLDTLGLQTTLTRGENGIEDAQARIGWGQAQASYRLTVDRRADSGLQGSNGHNQVSRVNFRADLSATPYDEVQLRLGGLSVESGKGYARKPDDPLRDLSFNSGYLQLDWRRILNEDSDVAFSLSHTEEAYRDLFLIDLMPLFGLNKSIKVDSGGRTRNDKVSLQHTFRQGADWRFVWGGEFQREQVTSPPIYNTDAAFVTDFTRLFGNAEWRLAPRFVLNAGAMAENSSDSGDSFAPRLMLNWHLTSNQTLRAGASRAYRPPSALEKYSHILFKVPGFPDRVTTHASGNVQSERVLAQELGYLGDFPNQGLQLDVRAFHEQFTGRVNRSKSQPGQPNRPFDYLNNEDFLIRGLEYQLKWQPWSGTEWRLNQTWMNIASVNPATVLAAPKLTSALMLFQKLPGGLDLSVMYQNSGFMAPQGASADKKAAMTRTDLRLSAPLRFGANRGELSLVLQNLGSPYQDFAPDFRFERRAFVMLQIEH